MNKIFAFDLDGTLAVSKGPIDKQMVCLLLGLLEHHNVCVISGGAWKQFQKQLIDHLVEGGADSAALDALHCFPTCGTTYYRHNGSGEECRQFAKFEQVYNLKLSADEKLDIMATFDVAFAETEYEEWLEPSAIFGDVIEDRDSQITFSACGQDAPYDIKKVWDASRSKRQLLINIMQPLLPEFDVRFGGASSIDVTRKEYSKKLAIKKILEYFPVTIQDLVYFGDALDPGGNDHAVYEYGVECVPVNNHIDCAWKVRQYVRTMGV